MPTERKHTTLTSRLDKAFQELLEKSGPRPSSSKNQGGGDREPTPTPQHLHQGELNLATERSFLEPNKVRFMDELDTFTANVDRHREEQPSLVRAKTYPHLVFVDPPASPDREASSSPRKRRAASNPPGEAPRPPLTPLQTRENLVWKCQTHSQCHWNPKW